MARIRNSHRASTVAARRERIQANSTTTIATVIRTALQAGYLLLLPRLVDTETAAQVFLAVSVSTVAAPLASLGSQFRLIKTLAAGRGNLKDVIPSFLIGPLLLIGVAGLVSRIYSIGFAPYFFEFFAIYLLVNYLRMFADTLAQGYSIYNVSQIGYIALWGLKLFATWSISRQVPVNFGMIALIEVGVSIPWIGVTCTYMRRHWPIDAFQLPWKEDLQIILATGVRSIWLEADRLLLPLFLGPASYVSYSIVSRAAVGAQALVSAYLGVITPKIVRSTARSIHLLLLSGIGITVIAIAAYLVGAGAVLVIYPNLGAMYILILVLGLALIPTYYAASMYSDYVFYNISASGRVTINLIGAGMTVVGIGLTAITNWVPATTIGLLASFSLGTAYAKYRIRKSIPC
jgi:hypothetical protein